MGALTRQVIVPVPRETPEQIAERAAREEMRTLGVLFWACTGVTGALALLSWLTGW